MSKSLPVLSPGAPCCVPLSTHTIDEDRAQDLARVFKALGDPARLRLLGLIMGAPDREACVCDLGQGFDLSQPTISHHLRQLTDVGLIEREQRGKWAWFRLRDDRLAALRTALGEGLQLADVAR